MATHTNHASRGGGGPSSETTTRARFVNEDIKVFQKQLAISNVGAGKTAAAVNTTFGLQLTRRQVAYHQGLAAIAMDLQDAMDLEQNGRGSRSDLDILIDLLKTKGASYCALYHSKEGSTFELPNKPSKKQPFPKNKVVDKNKKDNNNKNLQIGCSTSLANDHTATDMIPAGKECLWTEIGGDDMMKYARESRRAVKATDNQDVLIALVWVLPEGKRLFQAFPEVMYIDGTHNTNNEKRPLITIGIRNSNGNVPIVLRAFVPNERAWLFRWLFQDAIPSLLG